MTDKFSRNRIIYAILIMCVMASILFAHIQKFLDYPQMIGFIFSAVLLLVSIYNLSASDRMADAAEKQVEAVRESMNLDVMPRFYFRARPANDYWKLPAVDREKWLQGVGLYFQNLGRGPAFNLKLEIKIIGKNERTVNETIDKINLNELYSIPSPPNPKLIIKEDDVKLIVKAQYENIAMPPVPYSIEVPIDITHKLFETPNKPREQIPSPP